MSVKNYWLIWNSTCPWGVLRHLFAPSLHLQQLFLGLTPLVLTVDFIVTLKILQHGPNLRYRRRTGPEDSNPALNQWKKPLSLCQKLHVNYFHLVAFGASWVQWSLPPWYVPHMIPYRVVFACVAYFCSFICAKRHTIATAIPITDHEMPCFQLRQPYENIWSVAWLSDFWV